MNSLEQEVLKAVNDLKVVTATGKELDEQDLENLFIASLLEEEYQDAK